MKLCSMDWREAIEAARTLQARWIGPAYKPDLGRIQAVIRQEIAWTKLNPSRMTSGCLADCRNDLKCVGSLIKHHSNLFPGKARASQ